MRMYFYRAVSCYQVVVVDHQGWVEVGDVVAGQGVVEGSVLLEESNFPHGTDVVDPIQQKPNWQEVKSCSLEEIKRKQFLKPWKRKKRKWYPLCD